MRFDTLEQWLAWQETLHPNKIDLGLARVRQVWERCRGSAPLPFPVVTVAGTNGKGSTVALLDAILRAAGYKVGAYSSPHLLRYNERVRINGEDAQDQALCEAFERIEQARGGISLTYFEFGTLAALLLFEAAGLDVAVLEVGMGGRLDAVNIVDADIAVITSIAIDHAEWLGNDRETIGREKAGIMRAGRPAVCADPRPPASLGETAAQIGARWYRIGEDFGYAKGESGWDWHGFGGERRALPFPALFGEVQLRNACAALAACALLTPRLPVDDAAVRRGLQGVRLPGRFQVQEGKVARIFDVSHNPEGAAVLRQNLASLAGTGRTLALLGMLADKDVEAVVAALGDAVDAWYCAGLENETPRGLSGEALARRVSAAAATRPVRAFPDVAAAYHALQAEAREGDRILVFGSFYTVAVAITQCV